ARASSRPWAARSPCRRSGRSLARQREEVGELFDHGVVATLLEPGGDAGREMPAQQLGLELLQRALDGERLLQDVDAVGVVLDHLADALDVTLDRCETRVELALLCLHRMPPTAS